jgi:hypothetical protein
MASYDFLLASCQSRVDFIRYMSFLQDLLLSTISPAEYNFVVTYFPQNVPSYFLHYEHCTKVSYTNVFSSMLYLIPENYIYEEKSYLLEYNAVYSIECQQHLHARN